VQTIITLCITVKVLHQSCLERWCRISGKHREDACPHKCKAQDLEAAENALLSLASASQSQQFNESQPLNLPGSSTLVDVDIEEQPLLQGQDSQQIID